MLGWDLSKTQLFWAHPHPCKEPLTHAPGSIPTNSFSHKDGIRWSRYLVVVAALSGMKACSCLSRKYNKLQMIWGHIAHDQPAQRAQRHSLLECEGIAVRYNVAFNLLCDQQIHLASLGPSMTCKVWTSRVICVLRHDRRKNRKHYIPLARGPEMACDTISVGMASPFFQRTFSLSRDSISQKNQRTVPANRQASLWQWVSICFHLIFLWRWCRIPQREPHSVSALMFT